MEFAAPESADTKLPWTTAAPLLDSPNVISDTILLSSTIVPQVLQTPSAIFGAGHVLFGHRRRAFAAPTAAALRIGVGARMGRMLLNGLGGRTGTGRAGRGIVCVFRLYLRFFFVLLLR